MPESESNLSELRQRLALPLDEVARRDAAVFHHQALSSPCLRTVVEAKGSWLVDSEGRRLLDLHGNSAHQVGYGHPRVIEAIAHQLRTLPFSPRRYANEPATRLAEELSRRVPGGPHRILLVPGGSAAIGVALKIAKLATGRHKTISFWDSFHGAGMDAASVGGQAMFRESMGPLLPGAQQVPPPDPFRCPLGCRGVCTLRCADYLEYVLEQEGDIAAVVAEPIRATTATVPPPAFWPTIRAACDRAGALLIFDEIPTGLGRTGTMFAQEHFGVVPDITVLGKGLGGAAIPIAAVVTREAHHVGRDRALGHYTHEKSPLGAAAALATLAVIDEEGLVERSATAGAAFAAQLRRNLADHPTVTEVRQVGLLIGIQTARPEVAERAVYRCLEAGVSLKASGPVVVVTPPLTVTDEELSLARSALLTALEPSVEADDDGKEVGA